MFTGQACGRPAAFFLLAACVSLVAPQAVRAQEPAAPGHLEVSVRNEQITLRAQQVPLRRVIDALGEAAGVEIHAGSVPDRLVTADYRGITVEETLDRLGVNYVLFYRRPKDGGADQLTGGWTVRTGLTPEEHAIATRILEQIGQLRDDDIRGNGLQAFMDLLKAGEEAVPYLEQALRDGDYQARQFAAEVLERMGDRYAPSARFLEVLIEGMRDDAYPYGPNRQGESVYMPMANAQRAYRYFIDHPDAVDRAESVLASRLHSDDPQQRFLAAVILAENRKTAYAPRLAQVLTAHLADNELTGDATSASYALGQLGQAARPYLERYRRSPDAQQADLAEHILYHIDDPGAPPRRPGGGGIGSVVLDPVTHKPYLSMIGWRAEQFPKLN